VTGPLWLARHWPLATRCRIAGRRNPVRPSELDPQGRSRRPVSHAGCPSTSSEAAGGALLRFTPRPRSAPRSAARFPLAGASVPVSAIESCEHRKWTCAAGGDLQPDLRTVPLALCHLLALAGQHPGHHRSLRVQKKPRRAGPFSAPIVLQPPPSPRFPAETGSLFNAGPTKIPFSSAGSRLSWRSPDRNRPAGS
jgi:hypothetical protein